MSGKPSQGDCSLEVLQVNITFDDGLWECQVTSSDFQSQDALASKPARLVVRGKLKKQKETSRTGKEKKKKLCLEHHEVGGSIVIIPLAPRKMHSQKERDSGVKRF